MLIKVKETSSWTEIRVAERLEGADPRVGLLRGCRNAYVWSAEKVVKANCPSEVLTHCPSAYR